MTPFLKELLLITNPNVLNLAEYLNKSSLLYVLPCFYLAMAFEFFGSWNFKDVIKRSMIAVIAIKLLTPIHVQCVEQSLEVSSQLVQRYSPRNKFLTAYKTTKMDKKAGVWSKLSSIVEIIVEDPIVLIIFLLSYISFFLLTQLYSLVYHLSIVFFGLSALLSIFPMTSRALSGAIKSSLWCILMPFVVAIVLCLIGDSDAFLKTYDGGIVQNLESLIQLLIMTIILLMTPMITSKLMSDAGLASVAENVGQMVAMGTLVGATGLLGGKAALALKAAHNVSTGPAMKFGKNKLSESASGIMEKKGVAPTVSSIAGNHGLKDNLKAKGGDFKRSFQNTSLIEKATVAADSIVNRNENKLAKAVRKQDAHKVENHPQARSELLPLSSYKREVQDFQRKTGSNAQDYNFTKPQLMNFHLNDGKRTKYMPKSEEGTFRYSKDSWNSMSQDSRNQIQQKYGRGKEFNGRNGYVYFPKEQGRAPMPSSIYDRTLKSKNLKELRDEKAFLR